MKRAFLALVVCLFLLACGAAQKAPEGSVYLDMLGTIPNNLGSPRTVWINDYAKFASIVGAPLPGPDTSQADLQRFLTGLAEIPAWGRSPQIISYRPYIRASENLALDLRNAEQSVLVMAPSGTLSVVKGRFDPDATQSALLACTECPAPRLMDHRGMSFYTWDAEDKESAQVAGPNSAFIGYVQGRQIAVQPSYVIDTSSLESMNVVIETVKAEQGSLADTANFRSLAEEMTRLETYAAVFTDIPIPSYDEVLTLCSESQMEKHHPSSVEICQQNLTEHLKKVQILRPFQAFAMGVGTDESGPYLALVLLHEDPNKAAENLGLLRKRLESDEVYLWSNIIGASYHLEAAARGPILSAKISGNVPLGEKWIELFDGLFTATAPLLIHE